MGCIISLFIYALAVPEGSQVIFFGQAFSKSGIFFGLILSGIIGYAILKIRLNNAEQK